MGKFVYLMVPAKKHKHYTLCAGKMRNSLASCDLRDPGWTGAFICVRFLLKESQAFRPSGDRGIKESGRGQTTQSEKKKRIPTAALPLFHAVSESLKSRGLWAHNTNQ